MAARALPKRRVRIHVKSVVRAVDRLLPHHRLAQFLGGLLLHGRVTVLRFDRSLEMLFLWPAAGALTKGGVRIHVQHELLARCLFPRRHFLAQLLLVDRLPLRLGALERLGRVLRLWTAAHALSKIGGLHIDAVLLARGDVVVVRKARAHLLRVDDGRRHRLVALDSRVSVLSFGSAADTVAKVLSLHVDMVLVARIVLLLGHLSSQLG
mmetsp:Transcript_20459/g.44473  ORF Transcript_20459/g.44473 Transcript_20459/m.44473 type:complete len:209 (+) Transcript_20459:491-1117(+)